MFSHCSNCLMNTLNRSHMAGCNLYFQKSQLWDWKLQSEGCDMRVSLFIFPLIYYWKCGQKCKCHNINRKGWKTNLPAKIMRHLGTKSFISFLPFLLFTWKTDHVYCEVIIHMFLWYWLNRSHCVILPNNISHNALHKCIIEAASAMCYFYP